MKVLTIRHLLKARRLMDSYPGPYRGFKKIREKKMTKWTRAAKLLERAEEMEQALGEIRATCVINKRRHSKKDEPLFYELADAIRKIAQRGLKARP